MQISEFGFRLFLIFIPGIIAFLIVDALTVHKPTSPFFATLNSAVLGLVSYLVYYPISLWLHVPYDFLFMVGNTTSPIAYSDVAWATGLSIPIGLIVAAMVYHKVLFRFASWMHISNKISDPGVWSHILSLDARKEDTQWINMIDRDRGLLYLGFLQYFSETSDDESEYYLRNVDVYSYKNEKPGKLLYQTPAMYLNGARDRYQIEFPNVPYLPTVGRTATLSDPPQGDSPTRLEKP